MSPPLKIDDLKRKHHSYLRNRLISQVFYNRGLIEGWATGINKMFSLCRKAELPEPELKEYSGGFEVILRFAKPKPVSMINDKIIVELNVRQQEILRIIKKHNATSIQQIMQELKDPPSRTMIKRDLDYMRQHDLIDLEGAARNAVWVLKT